MIITTPRLRSVLRLFAAAATSAFLACAPTKPAPKAVDSTAQANAQLRAVHDSVAAMLTDFADKMSNGDLAGAGLLYSNDSSFYWIENGSLRFQNTAEMRKSLLTLKNIPQIKMTLYETAHRCPVANYRVRPHGIFPRAAIRSGPRRYVRWIHDNSGRARCRRLAHAERTHKFTAAKAGDVVCARTSTRH